MSHIDHFSYGLLTPVLAYVMSSVGCMLGLLLTARAREAAGAARVRWLMGGALSIGGTGIWVMHFVAMMGFSIGGGQIRYDVPLTIGSAALAVVIVGAGLFLVSYQGERFVPLVSGGVLTGLGVAGMHYIGMFAMRMPAHLSFDPVLVGVSVAIAIAASIVALWFSLRISGVLATGGAAMIMALAVCGMHYTGMFALEVHPRLSSAPLGGAKGIDFMLPTLAVLGLLTLGLLLTVILSPSQPELDHDATLLARLENRRAEARLHEPVTPPAAQGPKGPSLFDSQER
ncbi:MHYT domain-containing protein [Streptosporangium sp. CA-115845]|uniref:MHYT domain-containing protein n=1 Tax=Streptosporangium sp. CA-115845 TaxID=3240071 RepID=UPI003D8E3F71